jgi:hypothetical protein
MPTLDELTTYNALRERISAHRFYLNPLKKRFTHLLVPLTPYKVPLILDFPPQSYLNPRTPKAQLAAAFKLVIITNNEHT